MVLLQMMIAMGAVGLIFILIIGCELNHLHVVSTLYCSCPFPCLTLFGVALTLFFSSAFPLSLSLFPAHHLFRRPAILRCCWGNQGSSFKNPFLVQQGNSFKRIEAGSDGMCIIRGFLLVKQIKCLFAAGVSRLLNLFPSSVADHRTQLTLVTLFFLSFMLHTLGY